MLAGLRQLLMSPLTGPIALAVAIALAAALGVSTSAWEAERAGYEARIVELTRASDRAQTALRTQLTACHAAGVQREAMEAEFAQRGPRSDGARRLLDQQPEGIDACARMESADQAVLSNLKK
jgi:hypothetical protein